MFDLHFPLQVEESLSPARVEVVGRSMYEKTLSFNWTLEGVGDNYHIWNVPVDGVCAESQGGVCDVDVTAAQIHITGLTAGQGYIVLC